MSQAQIDNLIDQFLQARTEANQANEQRYQELLQSIGQLEQQTQGLYGDARETVAGLGDAERNRIQREQQRQLAQTEQDLISRGLGNTTIRQTARRGVQSDAERAQAELTERLAQQRAGLMQDQASALMQTGQMEAQAIEGRTDQGPAASRYAQMVQQLAAQPDGSRDETTVGRGLPQTPIDAGSGGLRSSISHGGGGGSGGGGGGGGLRSRIRSGGGTGGGTGGSGVTTITGGNGGESGTVVGADESIEGALAREERGRKKKKQQSGGGSGGESSLTWMDSWIGSQW